MNVGDVVIPKKGHYLKSGCEVYGYAVVVSEVPFIMVSEETDMLWSCFPIEGVKVVGVAPEVMLKECLKRYKKWEERKTKNEVCENNRQ